MLQLETKSIAEATPRNTGRIAMIPEFSFINFWGLFHALAVYRKFIILSWVLFPSKHYLAG